MNSENNIILYAMGVFDVRNPTPAQRQQMEQSIEELRHSGFTTVIQAFLHVDKNGSMFYNDGLTPMISAGNLNEAMYPTLRPMFLKLKASGSVNRLMFCIGGYNNQADFIHIGSLMKKYGIGQENPLYANFQQLIYVLGVDGIDFDLEMPDPLSYEPMTDVVVQLTEMLGSMGLQVTYCPYTVQDFWLDCLAQVCADQQGTQIVQWLNLQCYDGGAANQPKGWINAIATYKKPLGIGDPDAFVVPGYATVRPSSNCASNDSAHYLCPGQVSHRFSGLKARISGLSGGFLWQYADILNCEANNACKAAVKAKRYADAMIKGLSGAEILE